MSKVLVSRKAPAPAHPREAGAFRKRIGSTTYRVGVYFSGTSKETAHDKIVRLISLAAQRGEGANL